MIFCKSCNLPISDPIITDNTCNTVFEDRDGSTATLSEYFNSISHEINMTTSKCHCSSTSSIERRLYWLPKSDANVIVLNVSKYNSGNGNTTECAFINITRPIEVNGQCYR